MKSTVLTFLVCLLAVGRLEAASFSLGNLAVLRAEENDSNSPASIVELAPNVAGQTPTNVIAAPGMRISGSASSTGYVSHTNDRSLLTFTGVSSQDTAANVNTLNPRVVGTVNAAGTFAIPATSYQGASGNQTRSASSLDNSTWFFGDQGGFYSNGTAAASPSGNVRGVKAFGGSVYSFVASASLAPVNTISAPTGGTVTPLPGLANGTGNHQDFYLIQSGNSSAYDVLYILVTSSGTAGSIEKYSLVSGSWTANGAYATDFGGFGLAAQDQGAGGAGAFLYLTTGIGSTNANTARRLTDTAGYNAAISITTADNLILYTAPTGTNLKGIDLVPAVPEPATGSLAVVLAGAVAFASRRRRG